MPQAAVATCVEESGSGVGVGGRMGEDGGEGQAAAGTV